MMKHFKITTRFFVLAGMGLLADVASGQVVLGDSEAEFSGTQGQDDWSYGYRNFTQDGGARDFDPATDFLPFVEAEFDVANDKWDLGANAPWTEVGATAVHPNGTNNVDEHWAIRRWTPSDDFTGPTLVSVEWTIAAVNAGGSGVTGKLILNGVQEESVAIAGNNVEGVTTVSFLTIDDGDNVDLALTPVGANGDTSDGADGSSSKMTISTVVDTDSDLLADSWEESFFPDDLTQLTGSGDFDNDGLTDQEEFDLGTNPTEIDTDGDGLEDAWETNDGIFDSGMDTGTSPTNADTDGDTIADGDEINGDPSTNPNLFDTDADGAGDAEEILFGSDPNDDTDGPLTGALADSRTQFSGIDGQAGWRWGYRNLSLDDGGTDYDAAADFIPFPVDGTEVRSSTNFWNGAGYDWADDTGNINPPWTALAAETTHPNGINNTDEHWTVRRWTASGLGEETPVRVFWHMRKDNANGDGVTGAIHLNGEQVDARTIAGGDNIGFVHAYYLHLEDGDIVDLVLTPVGLTNANDGSDGSSNWMTIDKRIPEIPIQPNGKYFVPNFAEDSDSDGLADFWENVYFPDDLSQLAQGQDKDGDNLDDEVEQELGTDPTVADSDGDGIDDGEEVALGTNPCKTDSDGDGFGDGHEVATGYDPVDGSSNVTASTELLAQSVTDYPLTGSPQGENGWDYGYYNVTQNGVPTGTASYIPFPTNDSFALSADNFWDGTNFDWVNDADENANPPWTLLNANGGHPNGDNNVDVHWATRRWESEGGPLALSYSLRKLGIGGNGTSAIVLLNGVPLDQLAVEGTDATGSSSWYFVNTRPGDFVEIALSPQGPDGLDGDGADSSAFQMWVDPMIPANPLQPNGSVFRPGVLGDALRITSLVYDAENSRLTLKWTSREDREYLVRQLTSTDPVTWTVVGSTVEPDAGTETEETFSGITDPKGIFHVLEIEP